MHRLALLALIVPAVAHAAPPGETEPVPAPAPAPAPQGLDGVAAPDRALAAGTAFTAPGGSVEVSARVLGDVADVIGAAIGLGASTQLWGELSANGPSEQAIGLRHVVWRTPRAALAIEAELRHTPGDMTTSAPMLLFVGPAQGDAVAAGAIASACVDARCRVLASGGAYAEQGIDGGAPGPTWLATASVLAGGTRLRGVAEMTATPDPSDGTIDSALYVGARFGSSTFALDAGAAFGTDDATHGVTPIAGIVGRL